MRRLELFQFRYRDRLTGKWTRARYVAERHEIAARYTEWEIIGQPEIRDVDPDARYFTPWKIVPHAERTRIHELPPELQPHLAKPPRFWLRCFFDGTLHTARGGNGMHRCKVQRDYFEVCPLFPFRADE